MGYIIGNSRQRIIEKASESDFTDALQSRASLIEVPSTKIRQFRGGVSAADKSLAKKAFGDVTRNAPIFNDPRYTASTLAIPTDNRTLYGLFRFFAETDPIVGASLRIHSDLPLADLQLGQCEDSAIQTHYEEMWSNINGHRLLNDGVAEYFEIGDAFFFGAFNTTHYMWDQFAILNPDYVSVETTWVNQKPLIKLIPDEALKRIVQTQSPRFIYDQLPPEIIRYVLFNQEIPLDPNNVFHLSHAKRPYENRGKSLIKRILKTLMLEDRFNQATFALATRHAVPLTIVKVGDQKSIEGDHFITYKEGNELKIDTFEDFWEKYDGPIHPTEDMGEEVKDVSKHKLYTQSLDKDGQLTWNLIGGVLRHPTPDEVVEITTPLAKIRSTESHGFMRIHPSTLEYEKVNPLELEERDNPSIVTFDKFDYSIECKKYKGISLTEKFMYLFGLWTADGSLYRSFNYFGISNFNREGIGRYLLSAYQNDKYVNEVREKKYAADTQYVFESRKIKKMLLNLYGVNDIQRDNIKKEGREQVPQEILFNSSKKLSGAFFAGLFDGDGFILKDGYLMCAMVTSSKEFAHWISLGLLSRDIMSRVVSRSGAYEVLITSNKNLLNYINLISNYVRHSKKIDLILQYREDLLRGRDNNCKIYSYDLDENIINNLFSDSLERLPGGLLPLTYASYCKRLSRENINRYGINTETKDVVNKLCSVAVTKIRRVRKRTKFVYDLMLKDSPNTYIVGGDGWCLTRNTGWVPSGEELDEVREMMSAYELDPNFSIIWHWGIDVQYYGSNGKMLPIGPELDRLYRLKFIGMGIHEQLITGAGGTYSQAYINLEIQRQRYLNLQLKLKQMVHAGWFKSVADMCGFYRIKKTTSMAGQVRSYKYGTINEYRDVIASQFSTLRDIKDNVEFQEFITRKAEEKRNFEQSEVRDYIYPELDFGGMSAATDENLKNYIKWLTKERPHLVDDATLARLGKLDRDKAEKAFIKDAERTRDRWKELSEKGLMDFIPNAKGSKGGGGAGGLDIGGLPPAGIGGIEDLGGEGGPAEGGAPNEPIGAGGPPESAQGEGPISSSIDFNKEEKLVAQGIASDDVFIQSENKVLEKNKVHEKRAILRIINQ